MCILKNISPYNFDLNEYETSKDVKHRSIMRYRITRYNKDGRKVYYQETVNPLLLEKVKVGQTLYLTVELGTQWSNLWTLKQQI